MSTEYLGQQKIAGSAYAVTRAEQLTVYVGVCEEHDRPVRFDTGQSASSSAQIPCPVTGHLISGQRLTAVTTELDCDGACRSARLSECVCGCGGLNHGISWLSRMSYELTGVPLPNLGLELAAAEVVESELDKYRAKKAKVELGRQQRAEVKERKQRATFEDWAAEHAEVVRALEAHKPDALGYPQAGGNPFLADMARQLFTWDKPRPLTDNQLAATVRSLARDADRQARLAEREAAKRPCPEGKCEVSGRIVKITCREGYAGRTEVKATVACDGFAVWVTLPRAVENWARDNRSDVLWNGWKPSYRTDYYDASERWTNAVKGSQLGFTADVERSQRDESFGFAKRPVKVQFTPADPEVTDPEMEA